MAKYVSEDGVKAIRDWVKVHDNKSLYNLGYYDTYDASTNTITRQTGYIILDGSEDGWGIYTQGLWAYIKLNNIIPETNQNNVGQFITNRGPAVSITTMINTSSGIQIALGGESINIRPNVSSINSLETFKQWLAQNNIAIQYKLLTSTTERVEKNHYARYNQRFILEHNKSEAERSANLFNNTYNYSGTNNGVSINVVGNECVLNGTSTEGFFNVLGRTTLKAGTYSFSQVVLSGSINGDINAIKFGLCGYNTSFPLGQSTGTYTLTQDTTIDIVVWFGAAGITFNNCKLTYMLNEGSTPLPYQPYEGKVVHEKELGGYAKSIYGISQLYRHDIEFDILNGDGVKCTFWSTSNNKITDFSQIPYLAFSNIQVKNISNEKILNVVQWNSDGFRFYESDGTSTLIGDGYDGVTAYYINGEPQL